MNANANTISRYSVSLNFSEEYSPCYGYSDPYKFVLSVSGKINGELDEEFIETDEDVIYFEVGTFDIKIVDTLGADVERILFADVFDSYHETMDCFKSLYDMDNEEFTSEVENLIPDCQFNHNILILNRINIYSQFRGNKLGLVALRAVIERFKLGVGVIALKPFPLQFEGGYLHNPKDSENIKLGLDSFKLSQEKATEKLKRYYKKLGFMSVPRTDYMVLNPLQPLKLIK